MRHGRSTAMRTVGSQIRYPMREYHDWRNCGSALPEDVGEMAAVKVTKSVEEVDGDGAMPEWKRLSIERSLQGPRARAQERTDPFVAATIELMEERGSVDFTV